MAGRLYFYTDSNGDTQKYQYCSHCDAGPFKKDQEGIDFENLRPVCFCKRCINDLNIRLDQKFFFNKPVVAPEPPQAVVPPVDAAPVAIEIIEPPVEVLEVVPKKAVEPSKPVVIDPVESSDATPVKAELATDPMGMGSRWKQLSKAILQEIAGKKPIPVKNNYYAVLAQSPDSSYSTFISTNPKKDFEVINRGERTRFKNLPMELVYLRAHNNEKDAVITREIISKYKLPQKDKLVKVFEQQVFGSKK